MRNQKVPWWQLYAIALVMFPLFVLESLFPVSGVSGQIIDGGIVILCFGAMMVWVHLNGTLLQYDYDHRESSGDSYTITVYEADKDPNAETYRQDNFEQLVGGRVLPVASRVLNANEDDEKWLLN